MINYFVTYNHKYLPTVACRFFEIIKFDVFLFSRILMIDEWWSFGLFELYSNI